MVATHDREGVEETLRNIIVETRGCEESVVVANAKLFGDLGLESIDFLEISFRIEETFGFLLATDHLAVVTNWAGLPTTPEDLWDMRRDLVYVFGADEAAAIERAAELGDVSREYFLNRLTFGWLVEWAMRHINT